MKRIALALVLVSATTLGLSACSPTPADTGKPSILIWTDATREPSATAYAEKVADQVDITVEVKDQSNLLADIALANTTGSGWPDLVFGQPSMVAQWADPANGFAATLDDIVPSSFLDGYGTANAICEINGETYCLKNDIAQEVLWYDQTVFDALGLALPTTMEEFAETALKLKEAGYVSGALGGGEMYTEFMEPAGCTFADLDEQNNSLVVDPNSDACKNVVDIVQPLIDAGALDTRSPFDAGFISEVAQQGKVAMTFGPSWFGDFVFRPAESWAIPEGRLAAAEMPIWEGNEEAWSGQAGGGIWAISSHSEHPDAAADAVQWILSDEEQVLAGPTYPAYGPSAEIWGTKVSADTYYANDVMVAFNAQAQRLSPFKASVLFDLDNSVVASIGKVTQGSSVQDAIDDLASTVTNLAKEVGYTVETE